MDKIRFLVKKAFTPITVMVVPNDSIRSVNIKVPSIGILVSILFCAVGAYYIFSVAVSSLEYRSMAERVEFYSKNFSEWNSTVSSLKKVEEDFQKLFALKSKEKILENVDTSFSGSLDIPNLMQELQRTVETVDEIKDYLRIQKDIYLATPKGFPVYGNITSPYGKRDNPLSGDGQFHSGVDISASPGTPIQATADGVVSYSGWTKNSGYTVVLEHGLGFSTIYAHNKKNAVKVGEKVKMGDTIAYVGSTGKATGPHVHYEVWKDGRNVNPGKYLQGRT